MALQNRTSANELFAAMRWRSAVSRAYYAVYSAATSLLLDMGVTMPVGRTNPKHAALPALIGNNLTWLRMGARWRLAGLTRKLYDLRIASDYLPGVTVEQDEARIALRLMDQAFSCMGG
jgi:uncharacterized protein (UPF0332 family)